MEIKVLEIFSIKGKAGSCFVVESFIGWETIETFTAIGKASGEFTIIEREKARSGFTKTKGEPEYIGFIVIPKV